MRRYLLYLATVLALLIAGCGMQRPARTYPPIIENPTRAAVSPLSTPVIPKEGPSPSPRPATGTVTLPPSFTATGVATRTGTPVGPISPLATPVITASRTIGPPPTWTPLPASTGTPRPNPTPGGPPPAPTATPPGGPPALPTPTVPPFPFVVENAFGAPDCSKTEINGVLIDKNRQGLGGYRVRVGNVNGQWSTTTGATGGDGKYSLPLFNVPTAGRWYVVVVDATGREISPRAQVETTAGNCQPSQSGIQVGRVDFRKDY